MCLRTAAFQKVMYFIIRMLVLIFEGNLTNYTLTLLFACLSLTLITTIFQLDIDFTQVILEY